MRRHIALISVVLVVVAGAASGDPGGNGQEAAPGQQLPVNVAPPAISDDDSLQAGEWLTADAGTWDGKGLKYAYQWLHCDSDGGSCTPVPDATGTKYLLAPTDFGTRMRTLVTASNQKGTAVATSDASDVVSATTSTSTTTTETTTTETTTTSPSEPPSNTSPPTISGTAQQGETLSSTPGSWSGTTPLDYAYQWERCNSSGGSCAAIAGATETAYTVTSADVASTLRVSVTASNAAGSATAPSQPTPVVTAPSSTPDPAPASPPLIHSGFETDTSMDAMRNPAQNQTLYLHGIDSTTGSNWDTARFYGDRWRTTGLICGSTCPSGNSTDYFQSLVGTVTGPYGTSTKALNLGFVKESPTTCCQQVFIESSSLTSPVKEYYARYWMRFNPGLQSQADAQGSSYWRGIWEFKTWSDYRVMVYVMNHRQPGPHWYVKADNGGWRFSGGVTDYWSVNSSIKVPLDKWFYVEIYLRRAKDNSGRFLFAVNGQTVVDRAGPNYGQNNDEIAIMAHNMLYSSHKSNSYQWVDDFEIRDSAPCASLPCGSPPRLS